MRAMRDDSKKYTSRTSYSVAVVRHEWRAFAMARGSSVLGAIEPAPNFPGTSAARCAQRSLARRDYEVVHAEMTSTEHFNRAMAVFPAKGNASVASAAVRWQFCHR